MQFSEAIQALASCLRLPTLAPRPDGTCSLKLDDVLITFKSNEEAQAFTARAYVGSIGSREDFAHWMEELLTANLSAGGGSAFAMDTQGAIYITQRFQCSGLHFDRLRTDLEHLVDTAEHWHRRLPTESRPA